MSTSPPYDLHEGLCNALDGIQGTLVVKTGGGKMGLFYGYGKLHLHLLSSDLYNQDGLYRWNHYQAASPSLAGAS